MSIKMVPGYEIPQENGLDYQGYGRFGRYSDAVVVRGQGRVMTLSGLSRAAMGAFYGARLTEDPLYATMPDPAYGDYGACNCSPKPFRGFGAGEILTRGAITPEATKTPPTKTREVTYATRAEYLAARENVRLTAEGVNPNSGANPDAGTGTGADTGTPASPPAPAFELSPLMIGGLAAIGIGFFMMMKKKKGQ